MLRAGQCGVYLGDLHEVEERRVERVWYALAPEGVKTERYGKKEETVKKTQRGSRRSKGGKKQRRSSTIDEEEVTVKKGPNLGRIEFALRWIHNPDLVVMLPEQITRDEVHPEEAANSLLITLVRCRNLPVMDTGVFGGSSDPYCIIKVGDEQVKSTVRKKDLNPVWVESFELPNADKDAKVVFEVLDYDAYGTSDPIGRFALPFLALSDRKLMRRWFVLKDQVRPVWKLCLGDDAAVLTASSLERLHRRRAVDGTSRRPLRRTWRETQREAARRWRRGRRTKSSVASLASREADGVGERHTETGHKEKTQAGQKTGGKCEVALKWHVPASRYLRTAALVSAQTRTRSPRDTLFNIERVTPHPDPERPRVEAQLDL